MGAEPLTAKALSQRLTTEYPVTSSRHTKLKVRTYVGITPEADDEEPSGDR
jgi:hypothetical protein